MPVIHTGVYQIKNLINGRIYIGSAAGLGGFKERWRSHRNTIQTNKHKNPHLQSAWNKYGPEAFIFEILELCEPRLCLEREQYYLDTVLFASCNDDRFNQLGYNICRSVSRSNLGRKWSDEVKAKMGAPKIGRKYSDEHKAKIGNASRGNTHRLGSITSEATKEKLRQCRLGKKLSEESKNKVRLANQGENNPQSKLTKSDIYEIRSLLQQGLKQKDIAQQFMIDPSHVSDIKTGKKWRHV